MGIDSIVIERLIKLEERQKNMDSGIRRCNEAISSMHDDEIAPLLEFKAEMQGARRVYNLMWGVLCTAVVLDLTAQAFIYRQQTKNAEDIRGIQETQQLIISIMKGEYHAK